MIAHDVNRIAAALACSLIAADGIVEEEEKAVAISVGQNLLPGFSQILFEEQLAKLDRLPSPYQLALPLRHELDSEAKDQIINYLVAVANADHEIVQVEAQELKAVAKALGVPLPPLKVVKQRIAP